VEAARLLQDVSDIRFLFVGEGPVKAEVMALAQQYDLDNLQFHPEVPRERMPAFLSAADVALVPLRRLELFRGALPSKMFDAWAAGCPTLVSIEGEARSVLEEAGAGRYVTPEDPKSMARAIQSLAQDREACQRMGLCGRAFVQEHFSRRAQAHTLEQELLSVTTG
jgi:glycosyltransferase involved in cell wall biosynthesis